MKPVTTPASIVKGMILPVLFLFALPAFSAWFSGYASDDYDEQFRAAMLGGIRADASLDPAERAGLEAFYGRLSVAEVCASETPEFAGMRTQLGDGCDDFAQFRLARTVSYLTLALGFLALFIAVVGALAASTSRAMQYRSFVASFRILRVVSAAIVVFQGALAVWLSFWITAILFESYYVKLIILAAVLALFAIGAILKAIFAKSSDILPVSGLWVPREKAPGLFARIDAIAQRLGTKPPENLVAGIDDNFFVCEGKVSCTDRELEGRTLFVSLTLLRILDADETEAVLGHEMAHFSGGDVEHSTKLSPAINRVGLYLQGLGSTPLSIPVALFLAAVFDLFDLSFSKSRREREFAADAASAGITSPDAIARALVKIGAYASYGTRVEASLFERDSVHESLGIADRIRKGFGEYAQTPKLSFDLVDSQIPHPFDSHPPLLERIAAVGSSVREADFAGILLRESATGYYGAIEGAAELEARQWTDYEKQFSENHEFALLHRYRPETPEERAFVETRFPPQSFRTSSVPEFVRIDCLELRCSEWGDVVALAQVKAARIDNHLMREHLILDLESDGAFTSAHKIPLGSLSEKQAFLDAFNAYWNRARAADAYQKSHGR